MKEKLQKVSNTCKKIAEVCKIIFGYGIMISLFMGALIFLGYMAALIVGGETAQTICTVIYKHIVPVMIYISTGSVLFGLLTMYLGGEKALTSNKKKISKSEGER